MTDDVRSLLDALRQGKFDDPEEKISLLGAALLEDPGAGAAFLLSLLQAPQAVVRAAAILACKKRNEAEILSELKTLADDEDFRVRKSVAEILKPLPDKSFVAVLLKLCRDHSDPVRAAALRASGNEPALMAAQFAGLSSNQGWIIQTEAALALARQLRPDSVPLLFQALARDLSEDALSHCGDALEARMILGKGFLKAVPDDVKLLAEAEKNLVEIAADRFPNLLETIRARTHVRVSPDELKEFGTDLTALAENGELPPSFQFDEFPRRIAGILTGEKPRSIVLLGESGVGKSALVNELTRFLAKPENGGWRVLRMTPPDFITSTKYIGEWETRVHNLLQTIRRPRRVLLYIPNFNEIAGVGKHSKSDHNVLSVLLPQIQDGSITVVGESHPAEYDRGFARARSAQRAFEPVLLPPAEAAATAQILAHLRDHSKSAMTGAQLEQILELGEQFVINQSRPGNAVTLFKAVHAIERQTQKPVTSRLILETLATSSGLPVNLMDDSVPLDFDSARAFFEARVLGQPEAIEAVLDLVTLIKAGVTDPNKPMGILLFIGPTGVGKTELARALAEFIFGDAKRLLRFDMSEFAESDGFQRLIGTNAPGLLTSAVRQNPFAVILLDEIEKSHINVFDLCLQVFDAGRLTDGQGLTADFRRTIIVLTSNIGARKPVSPIGFQAGASSRAEDESRDHVNRELSLAFRPEFLNRIDRILHFRPLGLDVAENIARKEIDQVLRRAGIKRRNLAFDIDPSCISLLVKEGYSPSFGARPLKRAVERLLLIPLARSIAAGRLASAELVRITGRENKIHIQTVARKVAPKTPAPRLAAAFEVRMTKMEAGLEVVSKKSAEFSLQKEMLLERAQAPDFFKDPAAAAGVFDTIHRLEEFIAFAGRVKHSVERFKSGSQGLPAAAQLDRHLKEAEALVASGCAIAGAAAGAGLGDALVIFRRIDSSGDPIQAGELLRRTYDGYARRHRLAFESLGDDGDEKRPAYFFRLVGLGAYVLTLGESGLHEFEKKDRSRKTRDSREVWRIEVMPWLEDVPRAFGQKSARSGGRQPKSESRKGYALVSIFDPESMRSLTARLCGSHVEAFELGRSILYSLVKGDSSRETDSALRRKYELGSGSKIRDFKTGETTPHLDKFFDGCLELVS